MKSTSLPNFRVQPYAELLIAFVLLCGSLPTALSLSYFYFAFGSNMASSTMVNLRNLKPIASTAAVLYDHRLAFNVPGTPFVEPSWASVEVETGSSVHGVLYKLSEEDFTRVCQTEGVPFAYRLHRCDVVPYIGNGEDAGMQADETKTIKAFTLRAGRKSWRESKDIAPSQSYVNVLLRGAKEFQLDQDYVKQLENIQCAQNVIGGGMAEKMLQFAELRNKEQ